MEKEVGLIKKIIQPGPKHRLARFLFYAFMVGLAAIWLDPASRSWLLDNPLQAVGITIAIVGAMAIVLYLPEDSPYV